ncbi:serine/threonine-protein kinase WNK1-like [Halichondria panicea]|uniref:serine/threonine-protein kinase WNK1-like n=1 Tax=Halichondria panicea TaxID=6063 RepID=UPI00312B79D6
MAVNPQAFEQFTLRQVRITENEFGRGSYAVVMELEYRGLKCAGKKLYRVLYDTGIGHAARRYLEECHLLSQTRHPNIVQFLGVCFEEGSQFPILVMEFLPTNLTSCLERYGILPDEINFSILHDVSLGLVYLHGQTPIIVHRDLSANNVLLSTNMTAKISDLGVARILNLTPLQASRMTETPGTPAYMPPEVMVADPHYDTSVDVFSFGVMMIHTFTAEWPLPKIGPNRIDPANPDRLIPVTEAERREHFLRKITPDHPLMDLIMRCLSNNPQRRPRAVEIVGRMVGVVLEHPPSFENRVEMLQRVSALLTEKRELEEEVVRKDSAIQEKAGENEALAEEKRRQEEESENTVDCMQLVHSVETDQLKLENENLKGQLEDNETIVNMKDARITEVETQCKQLTEEVEQQIANVNYTHNELVSKATKIAQLETDVTNLTAQVEQEQACLADKNSIIAQKDSTIAVKDSTIAHKDSTIAHKDLMLASKDTSLQKKEATIQSLNNQLTKTRDYLTSKPQSLQVQLSYSQCSEAPVKMSSGQAITINGKVYYGGGICDYDDDDYCVHCYDPPQDVWSTLPRLPVRCFGLGEVKAELVAVGGMISSISTSNVVHVFNKGRNWKQTIPLMPTARHLSAVVSLPTHLVVAGGSLSPGNFIDIVEIYNISTSQWSETDRLPYACYYQRGIVYNNTVYLMGGYDGNYLNKVCAAQVDKLISADRQDDGSANKADSIWNTISNTPSYLPSPVTISDTLFAAGGAVSEREATQRIYAYSSSMDSWLYVGDLPSPIAGAATVSLSPSQCLMIGGWNNVRQSTVYKIRTATTIS